MEYLIPKNAIPLRAIADEASPITQYSLRAIRFQKRATDGKAVAVATDAFSLIELETPTLDDQNMPALSMEIDPLKNLKIEKKGLPALGLDLEKKELRSETVVVPFVENKEQYPNVDLLLSEKIKTEDPKASITIDIDRLVLLLQTLKKINGGTTTYATLSISEKGGHRAPLLLTLDVSQKCQNVNARALLMPISQP